MKKVSDILSYFLNKLLDFYPENELKSIMYISIDFHGFSLIFDNFEGFSHISIFMFIITISIFRNLNFSLAELV